MSKAPKFDEAEFMRALERVAKDTDLGETPSAFDPKLAKDVRDDKLRGNKIGRYVQALEGSGLVLVPARALGAWNNGQPHEEAMWIHPDYDLKVAFTEDDILQFFPGDTGPEDLWNFMTEKKRRLSAERAGLLLPS